MFLDVILDFVWGEMEKCGEKEGLSRWCFRFFVYWGLFFGGLPELAVGPTTDSLSWYLPIARAKRKAQPRSNGFGSRKPPNGDHRF